MAGQALPIVSTTIHFPASHLVVSCKEDQVRKELCADARLSPPHHLAAAVPPAAAWLRVRHIQQRMLCEGSAQVSRCNL